MKTIYTAELNAKLPVIVYVSPDGARAASAGVWISQAADVLAMASMPSFDPNSFSDGIGRIEWKMLSDDDHVPLRNKVLRGLYPPGSTVKPMVALSFLEAGLDPNASVNCGGGLRVGNRVFHCWNHRGHGATNMAKGIYQSCDVYFYSLDWDGREDIKRIDTKACKVALLTGSYDYSCTPDMTRDVARSIPGSRLGSMEGMGHFPMIGD